MKAKKLWLALMLGLSLLIAACGSDNKVAEPANTGGGGGGTQCTTNCGNQGNPTEISFQEFRTRVANGQFDNILGNDNYFIFSECSTVTDEIDLWLFDLNYLSTTCSEDFARSDANGIYYRGDNTALNSSNAIISYLLNIIDSADERVKVTDKKYEFYIDNGSGELDGYVISLDYPLVSNPTARATFYYYGQTVYHFEYDYILIDSLDI